MKCSANKMLAELGWREWVSLPQLGLDALKCKVDTGAKSSALHAFSVEEFYKSEELWVRFGIHPKQGSEEEAVWCESLVTDVRKVTDSGGHVTERYFITTDVVIGSYTFPIQVSLTNRDSMRFRMLLGREAINGRFWVNPEVSYRQGRKTL